jgi:hypothetical protein
VIVVGLILIAFAIAVLVILEVALNDRPRVLSWDEQLIAEYREREYQRARHSPPPIPTEDL